MANVQQTVVATPGGVGGDFRVTRQWAHGLCGCFDNMGICIIAWCFPCVTFGQAAEGLGKSCCVYGCLYLCQPLGWCLEANQRREIRRIRGIPGNCMTDLCLTLWCPMCTLIQELQEVEQLRADERLHSSAAGSVIVVNSTSTAQQGAPQTVYLQQPQTMYVQQPPQPGPEMQPSDQGYAPPAYSTSDVTLDMKRD